MADQQVMDAIRKRKGPWDSLIDGVSGIPDAISGGLSSARRADAPISDAIGDLDRNYNIENLIPGSQMDQENRSLAASRALPKSGSLGMGDLHKLENDYDHTDDSASNPTPMPPRSISNVPAAKPIDDTGDAVKQAIMARSNSNGRDDINRAIDASADNRFRAELGSAGSNFAYAISGVKNPNAGQFDALKKDANAPVEDLKTKTQMDRQSDLQDPNSTQSRIAVSLAQKQLKEAGMDPSVVRGLSAADLANFEPTLKTIESITARKQIMALKNKELGLSKDTKLDDHFKESLSKNEAYKQADTTMQSADALIDTVNQAIRNKTSASALPTELAAFASKGKRLHTATVDAFTNPNSDIMTKIRSGIARSTTGTIPPDVANDIVNYLNHEKQSAEQQKQNVLKTESEDFQKVHKRFPAIYTPGQSSKSTAAPLDNSDPRVQEALKHGYTPEEVQGFLNGR